MCLACSVIPLTLRNTTNTQRLVASQELLVVQGPTTKGRANQHHSAAPSWQLAPSRTTWGTAPAQRPGRASGTGGTSRSSSLSMNQGRASHEEALTRGTACAAVWRWRLSCQGARRRCLPGPCLARGANEIAGTALGLDEPAGAYRQAGSAMGRWDEGPSLDPRHVISHRASGMAWARLTAACFRVGTA